MDDRELSLRLHKENQKATIRSRGSAEFTSRTDNAAAYGSMALRSAIHMNGLSVLALPVYILQGEAGQLITWFVASAAIFVIGVILGGIASHQSYLSFIHGSQMAVCQMYIDLYRVDDIDQNRDLWQAQYPESLKHYDDCLEELESIQEKVESIFHRTPKIAWTSLGCFALGWLIAGFAVLS